MPKSLWLLIIGMVLNVTRSTFLWPVNTIYIHEHLGKSLTVAGIVLMINSGAGVLGNRLAACCLTGLVVTVPFLPEFRSPFLPLYC